MSLSKMKAVAPPAVHAELDKLQAAVASACSNDTAKMTSVWDVLAKLRSQVGAVPWGKWISFVIAEIPVIFAMVTSGSIDFAKLYADLLAFLYPPVAMGSIPA
jgi:hypothetical protein